MTCRDCNETLEGDGYRSVVYCPNCPDEILDQASYAAPDEGPFYCGFEDE